MLVVTVTKVTKAEGIASSLLDPYRYRIMHTVSNGRRSEERIGIAYGESAELAQAAFEAAVIDAGNVIQ